MNRIELLRRRSSAHAFAESAISDAELRHLVQAASLAPSAFHLQNGRFTAVCSPEAKQALCEAAFRQPKIVQPPPFSSSAAICWATKPWQPGCSRWSRPDKWIRPPLTAGWRSPSRPSTNNPRPSATRPCAAPHWRPWR
ncbi:hypothetical protein CLI92_02925 [Vandammella animalimorsus]|uniref:Nitroreductase domain-containing protein n=1 Tax=Vandammella animalimorsus TaxID=2029117 RepID=A0A2A2T7L7_9BURK|nr:hypothetical protein CK626_03695 [Vandammella animalimorsus]PAX17802.1 hypothetical protein CLI92_02925 [Vandammella animalimorsus]PAX19956.1 hypothetical protein CLI93_04350 [Vandammella animalimorsus]